MISTTAECSESRLVDRCGAALDVVHVAALVGDDQRALELAHVLGVDAEVGLQRDLDVHAGRHVDERAARPDRRVQRGELVVAGGDDRAEVLLEELGVLPQRGVGVHEDDTLALELLVDLVVDHLGLVLGGHARDEALALGLGDAEPLVGVLDVVGQVLPRLGLLLGGADEVLDVVEVDLGEIGTPGRHRLALEELQRALAALEHPFGLGLQRRDVGDDLGRDAASRGGACGVGVGPAELVDAEPFQFGAVDQYVRHALPLLLPCNRLSVRLIPLASRGARDRVMMCGWLQCEPKMAGYPHRALSRASRESPTPQVYRVALPAGRFSQCRHSPTRIRTEQRESLHPVAARPCRRADPPVRLAVVHRADHDHRDGRGRSAHRFGPRMPHLADLHGRLAGAHR